MLSKRDVQIVRIAVRWKWFTPEQGEDVLFLKRKFGGKLTVEEIIRRRAYLDDAEIGQLSEAADQSVGRRPGPRRAAPRAATMMATTGSAPSPAPAAPSTVPSRAPVRGRRAGMPADRLPTSMPSAGEEETDPHQSKSKIEQEVQSFQQERETDWMVRAQQHPGEADVAEDFEEDGAKTVVTSIEEILAKSRKKPPLSPAAPVAKVAPVAPAVRPEDPWANERTAVADPDQLEELRAQLTERPRQIAPPRKLQFENDVPTAPPDFDEPYLVPAPSALIEDQTTAAFEEAEEVLEGSIGPYSIVRMIARGSRGALYRARTSEGVDVAVKVIDTLVAARVGFIERMRLEAMRAAKIEAPQVVRIFDVGLVGSRPYLAMQYVDAWTLEERLDSGDRPDIAESLAIARDIALALAAAERERVLHRDVGPSNILVGRSGEAHLTGFALEKDPPTFPAPEGALDQRSDLFALGSTLYALVTGQNPMGPSVTVRALAPSLPEQVASVIDRLLAAQPEQRYQHASDVAMELEQAIAALRAVGFKGAAAPSAPPERALALRAAAASGVLAGFTIGVVVLARAIGLFGNAASRAAMNGAFAGALALIVALLLLSGLGLVRRGELPLPALSSSWLVGVQDGAGSLGAMLLVSGIALAPMAILNVVVAAASVALLASWFYGVLLRRTIALRRPDRGVGRMLAVLGDPSLARWRLVHVPMLATLALLASARFAFLAYFAST